MRHNPRSAVIDEAVVRRLVAENPWATLVTVAGGRLVASHYPVLLDEAAPRLTLLTHVGRPDEEVLRLDDGELLVIVAGPHGYVSPSWYGPDAVPIPTWDFAVAHLTGTPQRLSEAENLAVLTRLVDRFEDAVAAPVRLDPELGARAARGTVGLRLPVDDVVCKVKMSQGQDAETRRGVLAALRGDGPYANPSLADEMARAQAERPGGSNP